MLLRILSIGSICEGRLRPPRATCDGELFGKLAKEEPDVAKSKFLSESLGAASPASSCPGRGVQGEGR